MVWERVLLLALLGVVGVSEVSAQRVDDGTVSVDGGRIYYKAVGEGPPILVVHGGPGLGHDYFLPGMNELAQTHQLIFYDQRGSGRSEVRLDEATVSMDAFLSDITAILDELELERATVLGHSVGGLISMLYALENPERVSSLVLMASAEPGQRFATEGEAPTTRLPDSDVEELQTLVTSPAFMAFEAEAVSRALWLTFKGTFSDLRMAEELNLDLSDYTARNFSTVAQLLLGPLQGNFDYWDEIGGLAMPTLVLQGADDPAPSGIAEELDRTIPNSTLLLIEGAGHFPYIEKPSETLEGIRAFLSGNGILP